MFKLTWLLVASYYSSDSDNKRYERVANNIFMFSGIKITLTYFYLITLLLVFAYVHIHMYAYIYKYRIKHVTL